MTFFISSEFHNSQTSLFIKDSFTGGTFTLWENTERWIKVMVNPYRPIVNFADEFPTIKEFKIEYNLFIMDQAQDMDVLDACGVIKPTNGKVLNEYRNLQ